MNLQSLVVVALRLMALDFIVRSADQLFPAVFWLLNASHNLGGNDWASAKTVSWTVLLMLVVSAVVLWVFAPPIARLVTKSLPGELSLGALSLVDCYSIAFLGIGLFYMSSGIPAVLVWVHYSFTMALSNPGDAWKEKVNWYQAAQAIIPFLIGILLFVRGRDWSVKLARKHLQEEPLNPGPSPLR